MYYSVLYSACGGIQKKKFFVILSTFQAKNSLIAVKAQSELSVLHSDIRAVGFLIDDFSRAPMHPHIYISDIHAPK